MNCLKEQKFSDDPVSTFKLALSSRASSNSELFQTNWVPCLQHFEIGDASISHMALTGVAIESLSGPTSSCNGLVVTKLFSAKQEVVHGSLTCCYELEWFKDNIYQTLGGFYVSTYHCTAW